MRWNRDKNKLKEVTLAAKKYLRMEGIIQYDSSLDIMETLEGSGKFKEIEFHLTRDTIRIYQDYEAREQIEISRRFDAMNKSEEPNNWRIKGWWDLSWPEEGLDLEMSVVALHSGGPKKSKFEDPQLILQVADYLANTFAPHPDYEEGQKFDVDDHKGGVAFRIMIYHKNVHRYHPE